MQELTSVSGAMVGRPCRCGAVTLPGWRRCRACGERVKAAQSADTPRGTPRRLLSAQVLVFLGITLGVLSALLPWSQIQPHALASDPKLLAMNIPTFLVSALIVVMTLIPSSRIGALAALVPLTVLTAAGNSSDWLHGAESMGPGAWMSAASLIVSVLALVTGWRVFGLYLQVDRPSLAWAGAAVATVMVYLLGQFLPWNRTIYRMAAPGVTFDQNGRSVLITDCCVPFRDGTWISASRTGAEFLSVLVLGIVTAFFARRWAAGVGLGVLGVLMLADPVAWVVGARTSRIAPTDLWSAREVEELRLSVEQEMLPGGWIALGASVLLVLIGVFRILSAAVQEDPPGAMAAVEKTSAVNPAMSGPGSLSAEQGNGAMVLIDAESQVRVTHPHDGPALGLPRTGQRGENLALGGPLSKGSSYRCRYRARWRRTAVVLAALGVVSAYERASQSGSQAALPFIIDIMFGLVFNVLVTASLVNLVVALFPSRGRGPTKPGSQDGQPQS